MTWRDAEVVDAAALRMIVNALLIARYGCAVLDIHERGAQGMKPLHLRWKATTCWLWNGSRDDTRHMAEFLILSTHCPLGAGASISGCF